MKDDRVYLDHILSCISRIEAYTHNDKTIFLTSPLVQDAVLRNLQVLAESTQKLSPACKAAAPGTDWRAIAGFRNILVHSYLGLDLDRIWTVVERRLPALRETVSALLTGSDQN